MGNRHVVQDPSGGWAVKTPGRSQPVSKHPTQQEAQRAAREAVRRDGGGEVVTHGTDGRIRDSETVAPGHDPFPPRDRS